MNEIVPVGPVSPLRQRLIEDMTMRRFSHETQRNYLRDVGRFATWLGRSPHTASAEDVRQFQIGQQEAGVPAPTMNSIVAALRFFFTHTLDRPDLARKHRLRAIDSRTLGHRPFLQALLGRTRRGPPWRSAESPCRALSQGYPAGRSDRPPAHQPHLHKRHREVETRPSRHLDQILCPSWFSPSGASSCEVAAI